MKKHKIGVTDIALAALGLMFFVGALTFLRACGPKDDGSWMTCHWAHNAVSGVAAALLALAVARLFVRGGVKIGLDIAAVVLSILAVCIPGGLIDLCMMDTMRCRAVMRPGVTVLSVLMIAAAAADIFIRQKREKA